MLSEEGLNSEGWTVPSDLAGVFVGEADITATIEKGSGQMLLSFGSGLMAAFEREREEELHGDGSANAIDTFFDALEKGGTFRLPPLTVRVEYTGQQSDLIGSYGELEEVLGGSSVRFEEPDTLDG